MNPSFFGPEGEQLLGIHHPARGASKDAGVVLCPPAPQERSRSHWALRKLADQLSKVGFDVLRFDLRGTGDSSGELEDTNPEKWVEDVRRAARELKDLTGVRRVSLVGFRLGALLAARATAEGLAVDHLVLWEPVINVWNWMAQLQVLEDEAYRRELHVHASVGAHEVYGFELPPALFEQWKALDLCQAPPWKARTAVVVAEDSAHLARLRLTWARTGQAATWHEVSGAKAAATGALLGNEALDEITSVLTGARR